MDDVSHEFRTPLTVITEYVSLLRDGIVGCVDPQQRRMLDIIGDRANDLNNMVDDMLDVSKFKSGLLGACRENCRIGPIVDHVRSSLERKATIRKAEFEIAIDDELPEVYCSPEKIGRVIVNLAVNAIKFCGEPGKVRLWAKHEPDSSQVVVSITDNGTGIEQAQLASIFVRFKQLDAQRSNTSKGFGLGLSIAKELIDLNLGRLLVESQGGAGSTFSFTVPVAQPAVVMTRYLDWLGRVRSHRPVISLLAVHIAVADKLLTCPVDLEEAKCSLRALFEQVDPATTTRDADAILPSTADDNGNAGSTSNRVVRADHARKPRERPLVLVIDDDPDISAAIALRLSTYSVDVLPAFAGMPGYWTAIDMHPDVILCDMRMPDGEGNYIVGRLQSHPLTQNIPIIIVTGQDNPGTRRVMLSMGVAAYFHKPIVMKDLIEELRRYILLPRAPRGPLAENSGVWLDTPAELKTV